MIKNIYSWFLNFNIDVIDADILSITAKYLYNGETTTARLYVENNPTIQFIRKYLV